MTISAQLFGFFADLRRSLFVAAVLTAVAAPATADAGMVRAGVYDGVWNVVFATEAGNCSSNNSVPFTVTGTRVSSAGGARSPAASPAAALFLSRSAPAHPRRAVAAGSQVTLERADGPGSSPATNAAAPGRPRGANFFTEYECLPHVVPAHAGTHNHRLQLVKKPSDFVPE